jgi:hypothetical protein
MSDLVERVAKAICAEKCAYRGEPSCAVVMEGTAYRFPPETCCEPGCLAEARAAIRVVRARVAAEIREASKASPYAKGRTQEFIYGLKDGYEAAAQVAIRKLGEE